MSARARGRIRVARCSKLARPTNTPQDAEEHPRNDVSDTPIKKIWIEEGCISCKLCQDIAPEIYVNIMNKRNHYEAVYSKVWTQCQQCQELLHQDVICTSRDCPVFYTRKKVQKDLREQQGMLDRFGVVDEW